ncbi:MAG: proline dehydrogenase [Bergeyella sp.]|nr:proline dehydrogenase [Bergeyella sp.]
MPDFNDTKVAFAGKSDRELYKAYLMFSLIKSPFLTKMGTRFLNFAVRQRFPGMDEIVKSTLFQQFCGGEDREETIEAIEKLYRSGVKSILDYSVEGKEDEESFDKVCDEIKKIIEFSVGRDAVPFVVFKPTAFGRIGIYEKVGAKVELSVQEKEEWERVLKRFDEVCALSYKHNKMVMIDAEETWMQDAVDAVCENLMEKYNQEKSIVWNTVQLYRKDRLEYMHAQLLSAREKGYFIGYKLVRGAYMEKERRRKDEMGYEDPIWSTKEETDQNYNRGINFVFEHLDCVSAFFGSHNEYSTSLVIKIMKEKNLPHDLPNIYFGQLFGMSDNITFYLAKNGYNAAKYLPYGPVKEVVPYLIRRAEENTSVSGQTGRELSLIRKEIQRRKKLGDHY